MGRNKALVLVPLILAAAVAAEETSGTPAVLTTSGGALVEYNDTDTLNEDLLDNEYFIDSITHFVRERIPERVVHPKGAAAFGYLEVTNDISSICKAKLFSEVGKTTPIAMRFSLSNVQRGGSDTTREPRGFAVKFYTEDGNFDIVGFNTPVVATKDPTSFSSLAHMQKPNPANNLRDLNMLWDFITSVPEALFLFVIANADIGIPDGYRHMPGWGIHTYQVVNDQGESNFVRFVFRPDAGIKNLMTEEAASIGCADPDYATRDLYYAIENGSFPSWTMSVQVLSMQDVQNASFDVFDVTKQLPVDQYPLQEVGRLVLNRNPTNFFASTEQLAFNVGNLVPGVLGSPDKIFQSRRFVYRDAQNYRLGSNFHNIEVNSALHKINGYTRDGVAPVLDNGRDGINYYPNSFNGPKPYVDENRPKLLKVQHDYSNNFEQVSDYYTKEMSEDERGRFVQNIATSLNATKQFLQERTVNIFKTINLEMGSRIGQALGLA